MATLGRSCITIQASFCRRWRRTLVGILAVTAFFIVISSVYFNARQGIIHSQSQVPKEILTTRPTPQIDRLERLKNSMVKLNPMNASIDRFAVPDDFARESTTIVDHLLRQKIHGFFLVLGAGDGDPITAFLERQRMWEGLLVEGREDKYKMLLTMPRTVTVWNVRVILNQSDLDLGDRDIRLDELFHVIGRPAIDLLVFNVQGQELAFVESLDLGFQRFKVIVMKVSTSQSFASTMTARLLFGHGYVLAHKIIDDALGVTELIFSGPHI